MARKLIYGGGEVAVDGKGIAGIEIHYSGKILYNSDHNSYQIRAGKNKILIFTLTKKDITGSLFYYEGTFKITKVIAADWNAKQVPLTTSREWFDSLNLSSLDFSTASIPMNDMVSSDKVGRKVKRTKQVRKNKLKDRKRKWDTKI